MNKLDDFINRFKHVHPPVIDYFLGWNPNLQSLGKLMISWVILERESEHVRKDYTNLNHQRLHDAAPYDQGLIRPKNFKDNWYRFILYKLISGSKRSSDLLKNKISFITFNYDVSLESALYRGLSAIEFLDQKDIEKFGNNRFFHMYGKIRQDAFANVQLVSTKIQENRRLKSYKDILDAAFIAAKGIRTIDPDDKEDSDIIQEARNRIERADHVYILGFGFDKNNCNRLNLKNLLSTGSVYSQCQIMKENISKKVYFTNFGDINSVNKKVSELLCGDSETFLPNNSAIFKHGGSLGNNHWSCYYEKSIRNVYDALEQDLDFF